MYHKQQTPQLVKDTTDLAEVTTFADTVTAKESNFTETVNAEASMETDDDNGAGWHKVTYKRRYSPEQ